MTAQAGWYEAPGEAGMLRYWSGETWTEHRQPAPPAGAPVAVVAEPVGAPTPVIVAPSAAVMQPFEAQFTPQPQFAAAEQNVAQPQYVPTAQPAFSPPPFDWTQAQPQPQWGQPQPQSAPPQYGQPQQPQQYGQPQSAPPQYGQLPPVQQPGSYPSAPPESPFQHFIGEARSAAANPANQGLAEEFGGAALAADGLVGFGRGRQGIGGAFMGMVIGLIFVVVGVLFLGYMGSQNTVGAGEKELSGLVTGMNTSTSTDSQGATSTNCSPVATYAVAGTSYSATSSISMSPCPYQVGQSVSVIYTVANPAVAHIAESSSTYWWLWAFPAIGALAFFGSFWTFIKRAGSIVGGIALIFNGRKRRAAGLQR